MSSPASFYVTLCSDSSRPFFKNNTIAHFSTQLPWALCPPGRAFEVAVCEVFLPQSTDIKDPSPIFLYSDFSQCIIVADTSARLLRVLSAHPSNGHYVFPLPFYIPVERQSFNSVTISLLNKKGERYPFRSGAHPCVITLHFREVTPTTPL